MQKFFVKFILFFPLVLFGEGIEEAVQYHKNSGLQWDLAVSFIQEIKWNQNDKILDVGCGDGKITALIAEICTEAAVVGVDISSSMIEFASANYNTDVYNNLVFFQSNAVALPFIHQFDKVTSFSALHWVLDQEEALKKIYLALVPKGSVHILTYAKAPMNIVTLSENLITSERWAPYFPSYKSSRIYYTAQEYKEILQKVGFSNIKITSKLNKFIYPNREALASFIMPLLSFTNHLPLEMKEKFIDEVIDQIISFQDISNTEIAFEIISLSAHGFK